MRARITWFDILIFSSMTYAVSDLIRYWNTTDFKSINILIFNISCNYSLWVYPMNYWLAVSYSLTLVIRLFHFIGHCLSIEETEYEIRELVNLQEPGKAGFNWRNAKTLKWISILLVGIFFPFFIWWTLTGIFWFSISYQDSPYCFSNFQEYLLE